MADNPKAAWPKTPDGTTDWEVVFEDPQAGLISLLSQAQSVDSLKMGATVVIEKLFTRKNDADARTVLIAKLEGIAATGAPLEDMAARVAVLLRTIKDERIEKARVYVERKRAGAAIDRRSGLLWKLDALLKPAVLIPVGAAFVLLLAGAVYFGLNTTLGPRGEITAEDIARQLAAERAARRAQEQANQAAGVVAPSALEPIPIWFKTVRWPVPTKYTKTRPNYYSVTLYVMQWDHKTDICGRLPAVMDRFHQSFNAFVPTDRLPRDSELRAAELDIRDAVNAMLPESYVVKTAVGRYGSREFTIASRPPYCKSPNVRQPTPAEGG